MVSAATYDRLERKPPIQPFVGSAPDIIGVGRARPEVKGYVDVPLRLSDVDVVYLLLIVSNLAFPLLVGTDILRPHAATLSIEKNSTIRFKYSSCEVCTEKRFNASTEPRSLKLVACAIDTYTIGACSAAVVRVRAPRASVDATAVALEPLMDLADDNRYSSIPAVSALVNDVSCVAVVNPSNSEVVIPAGAPVSEVISISATPSDVSSAAVTPRLSHEAKLRKVLHEL